MGYLGNEPTTGHFPVQTNLVGPGPTYTLDRAPASAGAIEVSVAGVLQPTTSYSVSGTTLTMAGVASGIPIFIRYLGETLILPTIADGAVVEAKIGASAVTTAKIANTAVTLAKLGADAVDGTKIADNAINSEHYTDASIDAAHLSVGLGGALSLDASPNTDHTANGPQTNTLASGYSSTIMDLVYLGSGSKWLEADSDATGTAINLLGIALEAKTDTQAMNVALSGSFVRDDSWSWTPGVPLYMSGTLGAITATKPTGTGDVVRTVGYAVHADYIFFAPSSDYVTLA